MLILTAGVALWAYSHLMKRVTPRFRAGLGDSRGKLVATVLALAALALMIYGYRSADTVQLWQPPAFLRHINNLLMLIAVILLNLGMSRGVLRTKMRHPMLGAVKVWALAHLLVNGDLGSIILFGGILAWAVRGCLLWQQEGLGLPKEVQDATDDHRTHQDPFGRFLDECTERPGSGDGIFQVQAKDLLYAQWKWARENDEQSLSAKELKAVAEEHDIPSKRSDGMQFRGIRLKPG